MDFPAAFIQYLSWSKEFKLFPVERGFHLDFRNILVLLHGNADNLIASLDIHHAVYYLIILTGDIISLFLLFHTFQVDLVLIHAAAGHIDPRLFIGLPFSFWIFIWYMGKTIVPAASSLTSSVRATPYIKSSFIKPRGMI